MSERYELVERIAVGGMAEVFRAKKYGSHGFAKQMAVKRILPSLAADEEFVTRFIAEAKIAVTLSHANIVQVFDFSRFGDSLYIAMEFVDGADLSDVLVRCRRAGSALGVAPAVHVAMEILKGLAFAHRKGVVHRDISPSNILVSRAGEVKIADFGIAHAAGLEMTKQHRVMGKWPYMSPEQTRGEELDVSSDLFSAGTVIYELLTGERLFRGKNAEEIVKAIAERPVPTPSSIRGELPAGLDAPLLALLERDPHKRPSAADVVTMLVEVSYQSTVQATAASLASEMERLVPVRDRDDTGSAKLLDDIINSELNHARGDARRNTRVTLEATGLGAGEIGDNTAMTFIKTSVGSEGISEWLVGDSTGTYSLKRTDQLYAMDDDGVDSERTIIDATSGAQARPLPVPRATPERPEPSGRKLWPIALSVALFAAIALFIGLSQRGSGEDGAVDAGVAVSRQTLDGQPMPLDAAAAKRLVFESEPAGATILVDGVDIGVTPKEIDHPGAARVEIRLAGFAPCSKTVGESSSGPIRCQLVAEKARLTVLSKPSGATVYLGGERIGVTPLRDFEVAAQDDTTEVVLRKRGFKKATQRVRLSAGSSARLQKSLEPEAEKGRVDIYSEPWANVYFRGKKIGVAPARGLLLPAGKHRLTLVNPVQNRRATITVTIPGPKRYKVKLP